MAPRDHSGLSLRWEFVPSAAADGSIQWRWRAYSQAGVLTAASERTFDTFTDCLDDARKNGYERPPLGG